MRREIRSENSASVGVDLHEIDPWLGRRRWTQLRMWRRLNNEESSELMTTETNQGLFGQEALEDPNSPIVVIGQILCVIIPLVIWFIPLPIDPPTQHALAIIGFMVVAWITRAMDYALAE